MAAHAAAMFNDANNNLRPGERGVVMCLACDRDQARIVLNYTRSYFTEIISQSRQFLGNRTGNSAPSSPTIRAKASTLAVVMSSVSPPQ
jgi:hypothetical protein